MTRSNVSRWCLRVAGLMTLVYVMLLGMTTGCNLAHLDQPQRHHHHEKPGPSSSLASCIWTCQATAETLTAISPPLTVAELTIGLAEPAPGRPVLSVYSSEVHSRAPPSFLFVRFG